jgi:hypothetical protein
MILAQVLARFAQSVIIAEVEPMLKNSVRRVTFVQKALK